MDHILLEPNQSKISVEKAIHIEGDLWLVPCRAVSVENIYMPMVKPLETSPKSAEYTKKKVWTDYEDEVLGKLVGSYGKKKWSMIAQKLNDSVHNGLKMRQSRQCRERWFNHIDPFMNRDSWTEQEDMLLIEKQKELGTKWNEISKFFKDKSEIQVKGHWRILIKKKTTPFSYFKYSPVADDDDKLSIVSSSFIDNLSFNFEPLN